MPKRATHSFTVEVQHPMGGRRLQVHSFASIVDSSSRALILGSMPGRASLQAGEYYAHPRNLFWRLMESLLGVDSRTPYGERIGQLLACRVALWDVLKSCTREGSLDSDIVSSSIVPNDFVSFLEEYPSIRTICFNGAKAAAFRKHVFPGLSDSSRLTFHCLPSTSPANASISFEKKLAAWGVLKPVAWRSLAPRVFGMQRPLVWVARRSGQDPANPTTQGGDFRVESSGRLRSRRVRLPRSDRSAVAFRAPRCGSLMVASM